MKGATQQKESKRAEGDSQSFSAAEIQWRFFSQEKAAQIMGIGQDLMTALMRVGAPRLGGKVNLPMLFKWIEDHPDEVAGLKAR